jgi:hypothetical protein
MQKDVDYYLTFLDENHPALYRHYTPVQFDSVRKIVLSECQNPLSVSDFHNILLKFNKLTDGHTFIHLRKNFDQVPYFPYFEVHNDSVLIKDKLLVAVNDFDATGLILDILNNQSWEYHPRTRELLVNEQLLFFLSAFYNINPPYMIQLKDIQTGEITHENIEQNSKNENFKPVKVILYPEESIAVIHYNTCRFSDRERELLGNGLKPYFQQMKNEKIKYLFIDISENSGGSDLSNEMIFQYLKSKKFKGNCFNKYTKKEIDKICTDNKRNWNDYLEKHCRNVFKHKIIEYKIKKASIKLDSFSQTGIFKDKTIINGNRKGFKGKVFVIQSRQTYSAATNFSISIKQRQMGLIVGEEPAEPIDFSGNREKGKLPHSKIEFYYATLFYWYEPSIGIGNEFITPDIPYKVFDDTVKELTIEDYKKIIEMSNNLKK